MNYKGDIYYIDQILKGDKKAFEYIVNRHKDNVFNLAIKICCNTEDAEEVAQDSFLKAFRALGRFKRESSFSTWLYRIVYNTSVSFVRSRKREVLSLDEFPVDASEFLRSASEEENPEEEYKMALINFAIAKLNEDDRALITLYYYEEMSVEEISDVTGINQNNVKVKLFRARQKMLETIGSVEKKKTVCYEQ